MVETAATATLSERELAEIERANRTGLRPVVFVHGPRLLPGGWQRWQDRFEQAGYTTIAPGRPDEVAVVADAGRDPSRVPQSMVQQVHAHHLEAVRHLMRPPAVVGHALGGLLALRLAGEGVSAATVAIGTAPFPGVQAAPGDPFGGETPVNARNPNRGPVLVIAGVDDRTVPLALARATYRLLKARNRGCVTEIAELPGLGHSVTTDNGWREAADTALQFLRRFA